MKREDIIRMAREAGIDIDAWEPLYEGDSAGFRVCEFTHVELERFASIVASAERERILDICKEGLWDAEGIRYHLDNQEMNNVATNDTSQERVAETSEKVHEPVAWFSTLPDGKLSIKIVGKPTEGNWEPLYTTPPQRNDVLEEVAKEFDKMPFGDTSASFAIFVRNMKR